MFSFSITEMCPFVERKIRARRKKRAMMTGASLRAKKSAGVRNGGFFTLRSARSIFGGVHAAAENKFKFLSPQDGET